MVPQPDPGQPTTTLLRTAYNTISAAIYRHVAQAAGPGLRPAHGNALEMLSLHDGLRLTDIAAQAGMAPQSMGELVDDLVAKGYLRRQEDPADRRAKRLYLTSKGRHTADAGEAAARQAEQQIQAAPGTRQYQQPRRNLAAIAHLGL